MSTKRNHKQPQDYQEDVYEGRRKTTMEIKDTSLSYEESILIRSIRRNGSKQTQLTTNSTKKSETSTKKEVPIRINTKIKSKEESSFEDHTSLWFSCIQNGHKSHISLFHSYYYPITVLINK